MGRQQPAPVGPLRVAGPAPAAAQLSGGVLADFGEHVVREADQVEPVRHHDRVREREADRVGVAGGQVDRHVGDGLSPGLGLAGQPGRHTRGGPALNVRQQPRGAGGIDDPGQPAIRDQHPPAGGRIASPAPLPTADLIAPEHAHRRWRRGQPLLHVRHERGMRDRPRHPIEITAGLHAPEALGDPGATRRPQPACQP